MTRDTRTYGHFCMLARALERLGDRWALLVVRDLLVAPRRFTDLMDRLRDITPKTLSGRLKDLQRQGIVHADREAGRREVWYTLTETGQDLAPVLEELTLWGFRNARRPRQPGEPLHPEHLLLALRVVLTRAPPPARPAQWAFRFTDDGDYTINFDGHDWTLTPNGSVDADVVITASAEAWADYLTTAPSERPTEPVGVQISGDPDALEGFRLALSHFPIGAAQAR